MNFQRLEVQIMNDEGFSAKPYLDTVDVPTIGYGSTHILGTPVTMTQETISPAVARGLLRSELYGACVDAQGLCSVFDSLSDVRQEVLANMAYTLGKTRLSGFTKFLNALDMQDYSAAAVEMLDSKWAKQVKGRANRLADAMRTGQWANG